jgi:plasmid stabilization system protein ParE
MARLIWAPQAADDLTAICTFIARDSEGYAREFAARVIGAVEMLEEFPELGHVVPEFTDPSLREILHGHYRIIYEVGGDAVHILAVHHGARLLRDRPSG